MHASDRHIFCVSVYGCGFKIICCFLSWSAIRRHFLFPSFATTISYLLAQLSFGFHGFFHWLLQIFDSIVDAVCYPFAMRKLSSMSLSLVCHNPSYICFVRVQALIQNELSDNSSVFRLYFVGFDSGSQQRFPTLSLSLSLVGSSTFQHIAYIIWYNS